MFLIGLEEIKFPRHLMKKLKKVYEFIIKNFNNHFYKCWNSEGILIDMP